MRVSPPTLALGLCLCGCGDTQETAPAAATDAGSSTSTSTTSSGTTADTKPWDEGSTTDLSTSTSTSTTTSDAPTTAATDGGDDTDGNDTGDAEEDFIGWTGWGAVEVGTSYMPEGEIVVFRNGVDECIVSWQGVATPSTDCMSCDFAFAITVTDAATEVEQGTTCSDNNVDPTMLTGTTFGVGLVDPEDLHLDLGAGFTPSEDGYGEVFDGQFEWAYPL